MKLSTLYTAVPEYIEFAWVTAPNASGQSITANTITTLTLDTEVADTGSLVSAPSSNQFTLPAGTYYFEASVQTVNTAADTQNLIFSLYNTTDAAYVTRTEDWHGPATWRPAAILNGQFAIAATKTFDLRLLATAQSGSIVVRSGTFTAPFTNSTAGADQRTTIKLWKLK